MKYIILLWCYRLVSCCALDTDECSVPESNDVQAKVFLMCLNFLKFVFFKEYVNRFAPTWMFQKYT